MALTQTRATQSLRRAVLLPAIIGADDEQLLDRFVQQRDEVAFEVLVRRHGPMVLGVCRRLLHNPADAEDAFQATFLVLVRKAESIAPRSMVGNWLHGVARKTALKARAAVGKRGLREKQLANLPESWQPTPDERWRDLQPLLDQEINRLPIQYRAPIVLCDLEGKAYKDAARQLGWPEGTLSVRLMRGRQMLAKRLTRRGVAVSGSSLALLLAQGSLSVAAPIALTTNTVKAAGCLVAGQAVAAGIISGKVANLTQGVLFAMLTNKIKTASVVVVGACLALFGGGLATHRIIGSQQADSGQPAAKKSESNPAVGDVHVQRGSVGQIKPEKDPRAEYLERLFRNFDERDREKMRGTWNVVSMTSRGKISTPVVRKWFIGKEKIVITPAWMVAGGAAPARQEASYRLWGDNNDKAPAANFINLTVHLIQASKDGTQSVEMPQTFRGIVAWEGERLKMCFQFLPAEVAARPSAFPAAPEEGEALMVIVLERDNTSPSTDEEKLQGDWKVVGGMMDGEEIDTSPGTFQMSFVGDLTMMTGFEGIMRFKLDAAKNPKQMTRTITLGTVERKGTCIYWLDGDDLKMCMNKAGADEAVPPEEFTAPKGSGRQLYILKRVKGADKAAKPTPQAKTDQEMLQGAWKVDSREAGGKQEKGELTEVFMVNGNRAWLLSSDAESGAGLYLNSSTLPKTIDLAMSERTIEGIYSLEGDVLRLCLDHDTNAKRPTLFATDAEKKGQVLLVLKRWNGVDVQNLRRADGSKIFPTPVEAVKEAQPPPNAGSTPPGTSLNNKPGDIELVEKLLQARHDYHRTLELLRAHYINSGDAERAKWAEEELRDYHRINHQAFRLDLDVPPPTLHASVNIPEAKKLLVLAKEYKDKGTGTTYIDNQRRAEILLQQLLTEYPTSNKIDEAAYLLGDLYESKAFEQFGRAALYFERCFQWNPATELNARLRAAHIYDKNLGNRERAIELYKEITTHETDARRIQEANDRLKELTSKK